MLYAGLALAVIACGLLWRSGFIPLPQWLSNNGGGALWALMVFVGFGFLFPRASTLAVAMLALTFSWGIEFSQLYHATWIDAIRKHPETLVWIVPLPDERLNGSLPQVRRYTVKSLAFRNHQNIRLQRCDA